MKKLFIFLAVLASLSIFRTASAQTPTPTINGTPPPFTFTGAVTQTGQNFNFTGVGTGVSSFSSGNLSPLFTTSVATATTTPALSFTLSTQTANTVFAGPSSGSAAAPTFRALVNADIPTTLTGITIDGVTPTVMGYVDPTSSIQTQLNGKQCTLTLTTTGTSGASTLVSCVLNIPQYSGGGGTPGGSSGQFQYNNSSSFGGVADLTYSTHTISGISTTIFDLSAATGTAAFKVPVHASNTATASGVIDFDSTANHYHVYDSGADDILCTHNNGECPAGSGNMSDSSGTTTVGDFPETTSTAHVYSLNTPATVLTQLGAAPALTCTTVSSLAPANNGCYKLSTSASAATPAASAFSIFKITTASGATATLTGTAIADGGNCSAYISGTTFALTGVETAVINSDGTNVWATCTAASSGVTLQTNSSNNSSQSTYNVINSSTNVAGLTDTVTNTTGGTVQHEIAGIVNVAHGGLGASNSSSTGVVQFASGTESVSTALASGTTATTQAAGDNSTKVQTTAGSNVVYGLVETSGSPFTLSCVSGLYWEASSGAYSWKLCTPPALPSSIQQCFGKSSTDAYVISIIPPTGVTIWYGGSAGTAGSSTGLVSPGTQADYICLVSVGATEYQAIGPGVGGTWVNH